MRRYVPILLAVVMLVVFAAPRLTYAADKAIDLKVTTDKTEVRRGDTITATVTMTANPGMALMIVSPVVGDGLTLVTENDKILCESGDIAYRDVTKGEKNLVIDFGSKDSTETGVLFRFFARVNDDAPAGEISISVAFREAQSYKGNVAYEKDDATVKAATVTVVTSAASTGPNATGPNATDPNVTEPTATGPAATEPTATGPAATTPGATGPADAGPATTEPADPTVTGPVTTDSASAGADVTRPTDEPEGNSAGGDVLFPVLFSIMALALAAGAVIVVIKIRKTHKKDQS